MNGLPLIWRFSEKAEVPSHDIDVYYDAEKRLNMVNIDAGCQPLINMRGVNLGTATSIKGEESDPDYIGLPSTYDTGTTTKARGEESEPDYMSLLSTYDTGTGTRANGEESDPDYMGLQ